MAIIITAPMKPTPEGLRLSFLFRNQKEKAAHFKNSGLFSF
jgi:hypothetical protein